MIYRRRTYKIKPVMLSVFTDFFHEYLLPNQYKHGAKLVGRWVNESQDEIMAMWEYKDYESYLAITEQIKGTELHQQAQQKRREIGDLFIDTKEEFLTPTGVYHPPKFIVSVSVYITNDEGEVLLIKNLHRSQTYEIPGGQVEEGESLHDAAIRETKEETGANVSLIGVTGIYQNMSKNITCVTFRGKYESGELRPAEGETSEVFFQSLDEDNVDHFIKQEHFKTRVIDAMNPTYIPFQSYKVRPYELQTRIQPINHQIK